MRRRRRFAPPPELRLHRGVPLDEPIGCGRCGWLLDEFSEWYEQVNPLGGRRRVHRLCARLPRPGFPGYAAPFGAGGA